MDEKTLGQKLGVFKIFHARRKRCAAPVQFSGLFRRSTVWVLLCAGMIAVSGQKGAATENTVLKESDRPILEGIECQELRGEHIAEMKKFANCISFYNDWKKERKRAARARHQEQVLAVEAALWAWLREDYFITDCRALPRVEKPKFGCELTGDLTVSEALEELVERRDALVGRLADLIERQRDLEGVSPVVVNPLLQAEHSELKAIEAAIDQRRVVLRLLRTLSRLSVSEQSGSKSHRLAKTADDLVVFRSPAGNGGVIGEVPKGEFVIAVDNAAFDDVGILADGLPFGYVAREAITEP